MNPPRRRFQIGAVLLAVITIPLALITLLSLEPLPLLPAGLNAAAGTIGQMLIQIVTVVGAIAVIIGVLNLLTVHGRKLRKFPGALYSGIMLLTFIAILGLHIAERAGVTLVAATPTSPAPNVTLTLADAIQVSIESALAGVLFFFLVYAAARLMRRRVTVWSLLFLATLVIVLLGYAPLSGLGFLSTLRDWLLKVPVEAGMRGLLIGVGIGTVIVGVRVLIGQDRAFRESSGGEAQ